MARYWLENGWIYYEGMSAATNARDQDGIKADWQNAEYVLDNDGQRRISSGQHLARAQLLETREATAKPASAKKPAAKKPAAKKSSTKNV